MLHAIDAFSLDDVPKATVRGQYQHGYSGGVEVPGYHEEKGVAPDSKTETYAAVRLEVSNWRWAKTPFFLRSGKAPAASRVGGRDSLQTPPHHLFSRSRREPQPNILLLRIQPDEGVSLRFASKVPGPDFQLRDVRMDFRYGTSFGGSSPDAYERLLLDAMLGDSTLFARRDEVEEAWRIVDSIVAGWDATEMRPEPYEAGTWGPPDANAILGGGRQWRKP